MYLSLALRLKAFIKNSKHGYEVGAFPFFLKPIIQRLKRPGIKISFLILVASLEII